MVQAPKFSKGEGFNLSNPGDFIFTVVLIILSVSLLTSVFPSVLGSFVTIASLDNFTFSNFFEAGGLIAIIFGIMVLIGIFMLLGVNIKSKR